MAATVCCNSKMYAPGSAPADSGDWRSCLRGVRPAAGGGGGERRGLARCSCVQGAGADCHASPLPSSLAPSSVSIAAAPQCPWATGVLVNAA